MQTHAKIHMLEDDAGVPTPERRAIANGYLVRDDLHDPKSASRAPIATRYRIATPIYKLKQDGRITEGEQKAADLFYRDYTLGQITPGMVAKYGERLGTGGTPLAQQANTDRLTPEELRTFHHSRYIGACRWIGHGPTIYWLTAVVCEVHVGESEKIPTFEDVGRAYGGYDCRKRAQAAGVTLICSGLERLTVFYGT